MPHVSVVIPAHNPGPYLEPAVASVLSQTYQDWELLVVDDGSTEDLVWVTKMHRRVRFLSQDNRGVSMARNLGVLEARGDLVAFLDHDDVPTKLERQVEAMEGDGEAAALCHTQFSIIDAAGETVAAGWGEHVGYHRMLAGYTGVLNLARASGDRVAQSAAGHGRRLLRGVYSRQAYDAARQAVHRRDPASLAAGLWTSFKLAPADTARRLAKYGLILVTRRSRRAALSARSLRPPSGGH